MKQLFYFSILFIALVSCKKSDEPFLPPTNNIDSLATIKNKMPGSSESYLALGDSYTIGQSVADSERFPIQVVKALREKNVEISNPDIIAETGWTTSNLLSALNSFAPAQSYSLVTLLIGVNNQYRGRSLDAYKTEFAELLNKSINYAGE